MPPRIFVAMIVVFWLFSFGWLIEREWLPWASWLHDDSPPPFTVEIADEAAPMPAHWVIRHGETPIGNATTRLFCRRDGSIELQSAIENLELPLDKPGALSPIKVSVPRLSTNQKVTRDGQLISINSNVQLVINFQGQKNEVHASFQGTAKDGQLFSRGKLESSSGDLEQELDPIPLESGSAMNPLQPVAKLRVWPGQRWKITSVDPLSLAIMSAAKKWPLLKIFDQASGPKSWDARVLSEPENLEHRGETFSCYVVVYRSGDITGRTWTRVSDGTVLRQEVSGMGQITLAMVRND